MKIRNQIWFRALILTVGLLLFSIRLDMISSQYPYVSVFFIDGELDIELDGILNEGYWSQTPLWGKTTTGKIRLGSNYIMEIKGIYNRTHVAFAFRWNDTTYNQQKNQWLFNGSKWINLYQQEDSLGLLFRFIDSNNSHKTDFWYWHAALTDPLNYADDLCFNEYFTDINDSSITNKWFIPDENESQGFIENSYNHQVGYTGIYNESDRPYWFSNGTIINETDLNDFDINDTLPGYILILGNGSRRDVRAKGCFNPQTGWTVEFIRHQVTEPIESLETYDMFLGGNNYYFRVFIEDGSFEDQRFWGGNLSTPHVDSFLFTPHDPKDTWTSTTPSVDISASTSTPLGFNNWCFVIIAILLPYGFKWYNNNKKI